MIERQRERFKDKILENTHRKIEPQERQTKRKIQR